MGILKLSTAVVFHSRGGCILAVKTGLATSFPLEKDRSTGAIHADAHAISWVYAQTPTNQLQHPLWKGPERMTSLISQCDKGCTGVLQLTVFLAKKHLLSLVPLQLTPYVSTEVGHSALWAASQQELWGLVFAVLTKWPWSTLMRLLLLCVQLARRLSPGLPHVENLPKAASLPHAGPMASKGVKRKSFEKLSFPLPTFP